MDDEARKDFLYGQVARIGKALSSRKRLQILDLLAQGEKAVELIASEAAIDNKLASAHLKVLKLARLVEIRRDGKRICYRLSGQDVANMGVMLRTVAQTHLAELCAALQPSAAPADQQVAIERKELLARARRGELIVLDVRPKREFDAGHLPHARSVPLAELALRLADLPESIEIVAYCRGPFCRMSDEAVRFLCARGFRASKIVDGVADWRAAGLPVQRRSGSNTRKAVAKNPR